MQTYEKPVVEIVDFAAENILNGEFGNLGSTEEGEEPA